MEYIDLKSRRYLGNKYSLLPMIEEAIEDIIVNIESVIDLFSGTGVVGEFFLNKGKDVYFNDILYSNKIIYEAWFGSESYCEDKTKSILSKFNQLNANEITENYFSITFKDTYFSHENCKKIGYIRESIENEHIEKKINNREKAILISSLLYSMDRISNTVGHYDSYLLNRKGLKDELKLFHPRIKEYKNQRVSIFNMDANKLGKKIETDLVYIDPPYNSRQYSDLYHLLENVASWEKPPVQFKAKKMDRSHIKSLYSLNEATKTFEDLIKNINSKYILVSYNNMGGRGNERSNAKIKDEDLLRILNKKGNVEIIEKPYNAFTTGKSEHVNNKERLFLCEVTKINSRLKNKVKIDELIKTSFNYTGGKYKLLPQLLNVFPDDFKDKTFIDLFCGGGNVGLNISAKKIICNDNNKQLIRLFKIFQRYDFNYINNKIHEIIRRYNLSDSASQGYDYYNSNSSNGLGRYNKDKYIQLRYDYNNMNTSYNKDFYLLVLIIYSFNNQIRFNKKNEFNLPVGKRDFNKSMQMNLYKTINRIHSLDIEFVAKDFKKIDVFKYEKPFVYCDPPYLLGIASYNENGGWTEKKERQLLEYLYELNSHNIKFALSNVIKHKDTTNYILIDWAIENKFDIINLNKDYSNSSYQKHNKEFKTDTQEVLIIN